ncbi:MAG: glycosyltransferase [Gammaproteobacteria bacterium]|nr:glycosyltransferase [Gammaproteobacteria bacterium]
MKICEIVASHGEGGLENHFVELCNGLAARGHEVHAIIPLAFTNLFSDGVIVHKLSFHLSRRNIVLLWHLFKTIKDINPDIIHSHASKGVDLMAIIKRYLPCPCIATIHNIKKQLRGYLKMDAVIGVSNGVLETVTSPVKRVIYNGVKQPSSTLSREAIVEKFNLSGQRPIVMAIGRLVDAKGFDVLINAWQGIDADLLIIGDGPLQTALTAQLKMLELDKNVHLIGFVENASALIVAAEFIVISSRREGFNYVMAEALFQSIPVISSDVPAPNEILPKNYLFPVADSHALHNCLQRCLNNPDVLASDYQTVFSWAQRTLSLEGMIASTEQLFNEVIASSIKR